MSTMRPPIVLMVIHIRGLAALKMEKDKKKNYTFRIAKNRKWRKKFNTERYIKMETKNITFKPN